MFLQSPWECDASLVLMRIKRGKVGEIFFVREVPPRLRQEMPTVFGMLISPSWK